ncbi:MAG: hypothetical protein U0599_25235 [Vicinamibacteria bacterium]
MRSTSPTAPARTRSAGRARLTTGSCSGSTVTPAWAFARGHSAARREATTSISARASARLAPGLSRPNTRRKPSWLPCCSSLNASGTHSSAPVAQKGGNAKPSGMTAETT